MMPCISFDTSIIDTSWNGLVNLKVNRNSYHIENHIDLGEF